MDSEMHERLAAIERALGRIGAIVDENTLVLNQLQAIAAEPDAEGALLKTLNRIEEALVAQTALLEGRLGRMGPHSGAGSNRQ